MFKGQTRHSGVHGFRWSSSAPAIPKSSSGVRAKSRGKKVQFLVKGPRFKAHTTHDQQHDCVVIGPCLRSTVQRSIGPQLALRRDGRGSTL